MQRLIGTKVTAVVTVAVSLACAAPAALASQTELRGRRIQTVNGLATFFNPLTGAITCEGSTSYQGTWGRDHPLHLHRNVNLLTGDITGTGRETFVGVATNGPVGTIHDTFSLVGMASPNRTGSSTNPNR